MILLEVWHVGANLAEKRGYLRGTAVRSKLSLSTGGTARLRRIQAETLRKADFV